MFDKRKHYAIALFWKDSFGDNTKVRKLMTDMIGDKPFQRKLSFMSVDIGSGQVVTFDETVPYEERIDAVISSTSIPFVFSPVELDGMHLIDGSVFSALSLGDPIERCREEGHDDSDIIIDVITCYPFPIETIKWTKEDSRWRNAYDYYNRRKDITQYYKWKEEVLRMVRGYPNIYWRLIIQPSAKLSASSPLSASVADVRAEVA